MSEKILIVDDDLDSLKLIGLMLQRHGYEVIAAGAGNQAISKAFSEHPDLIILDVMMPDMNGYEVCRRLRANPETQPIPIIMFTAKTLIDDKVAGFEAGADDYLTKPTHPAELASRVKSILQRSVNQRRKEVGKGLAIGVLGAKGGLGTTTLALNIGAALKLAGENPIVADFRLGAGSLGMFMGLGRSGGMASVLARPLAEIRPNLIEKELITHPTGLRALLSTARPKESLLNFPTESSISVIKSLRTLGKPVVIDMGSGYNTLISRLQVEMDCIVLAVDPIASTLTMARELMQELDPETLRRVHVVVVNRNQMNTQTAWHEVENALGQELRAIISPAPEVAAAASEAGVPLVNYQPTAIVSSQIVKLAEGLNVTMRSPA
ncbi:MAG: response regulator [Chitinophagaceae bacterium]|nr:response regulator [Anaerolineae bacterium]